MRARRAFGTTAKAKPQLTGLFKSSERLSLGTDNSSGDKSLREIPSRDGAHPNMDGRKTRPSFSTMTWWKYSTILPGFFRSGVLGENVEGWWSYVQIAHCERFDIIRNLNKPFSCRRWPPKLSLQPRQPVSVSDDQSFLIKLSKTPGWTSAQFWPKAYLTIRVGTLAVPHTRGAGIAMPLPGKTP